MFPYWIMFGWLAMGSLVAKPSDVQRGRALLLFMAVVLTLFIGLRYEVGPDWFAYEYIWSTARKSYTSFLERGDVAFSSALWLLHNWGAEFWSINLLCSIIFVAGLTSFAKRLPNSWLAFAVAFPYLIIVVAMSGVRQSAAIGMLLFAISAFSDRRFWLAAILLFVGALFHASAILMLGIASMAMSTNRLAGGAILLLTGIVGVYFLGSEFDVYIRRYNQNTVQSGGVIFRLIMNFVPAVIFLASRKRIPLKRHELSFWSLFSYISVALLPIGMIVSSTTAVDRFSLYFIPLQIFMLSWVPYVLFRHNRYEAFGVVLVILYLATALFVFLNFSTFSDAWIPYQSFLFSEVE